MPNTRNLQEEFKQWAIQNLPVSYRDIYCHQGNIDNLFSEIIRNYRSTFGVDNVFEVDMSNIRGKIDEIKKNLNSLSNQDNPFYDFNKKTGNGVPSAILNTHFVDFLESTKNKSSFDNQTDTTDPETTDSTKVTLDIQPLNQILFGPPGTGKTYNTVNKALQIIDPQFYKNNKNNRKDLTSRFKELLITDWSKGGQIAFTTFHQSFSYEDFVEGIKPQSPNKDDSCLKYVIEDGVFTLLCELAKDESREKTTRDQLSGDASSDSKKNVSSDQETVCKNYVLIIDEINRGNVSSIFGELITLIEEDKRKGAEEELTTILPYSKKPFSVPSNVYIIGTMNTADRSVESLDTALRRRFSFVEMAPQPTLLHTDIKTKTPNVSINIQKLLKTINKRIEKLIDKDHQIGHAYFIDAKSESCLKDIFRDKIIPLLEEYFFGDYGKIGLVLGNSFVEKENDTDFEFADFSDYDPYDLKERPIYKIKGESQWDFNSIYNTSTEND